LGVRAVNKEKTFIELLSIEVLKHCNTDYAESTD